MSLHKAVSCHSDKIAPCARSASRLCTTVQLSDTGLVPGSGVGNHRAAINRETLGVPVVAVGIPTVIADSTLAGELSGKLTKKDEIVVVCLQPRDRAEPSVGLWYHRSAAALPEHRGHYGVAGIKRKDSLHKQRAISFL